MRNLSYRVYLASTDNGVKPVLTALMTELGIRSVKDIFIVYLAGRNQEKIIKNRASFPNDESAVKLLFLSLKNIMKKWTMPVRNYGFKDKQPVYFRHLK